MFNNVLSYEICDEDHEESDLPAHMYNISGHTSPLHLIADLELTMQPYYASIRN